MIPIGGARWAAGIGAILALCALEGSALAQQSAGPPQDLDAQLRGIRGPVAYPGGWRTGRVVAGLGVLVAAAGLLAFAAVRAARGRSAATPPKIEPAVPPGALAIQRLRALDASGLWEQGANGAFADEFAEILRAFAGSTIAPGSHGATTEELVRRLQRTGRVDDAGVLQELLRGCDLVKFARRGMSPESPIRRAVAWVSGVEGGQEGGAVP